MERRLISSGSPFEAQIGYSRAVVSGDWVFVSGCTGYDYTTNIILPDIVAQTEQAMVNVNSALTEAGATMDDIVRVRYILPDRKEFPLCWPVLKKWLGDTRPAATMMQAGLMEEIMRIECEAQTGEESMVSFKEITQSEAGCNGCMFRQLPCEVRIMIFQEVIPETCDDMTPSLVIALRPEPIFYNEALEILYHHKIVRFGPGNGGFDNRRMFGDIKDSVLPLLKGLKVEFRSNVLCRDETQSLGIYPDLDSSPNLRVLHAKHIQVLHLDYSDMTKEFGGKYERALRQWISRFKRLSTLRVGIKYFHGGNQSWWFLDKELGDVVRRLNAHIGMAGRLVTVSTKCRFTVWSWEAEQGRVLTWVDDIPEAEEVPQTLS